MCGHAIMCDNEVGRNCFHCVVTEILIPPLHGGHDPNVQNCTEIMNLMQMKMFTLILGRVWIFSDDAHSGIENEAYIFVLQCTWEIESFLNLQWSERVSPRYSLFVWSLLSSKAKLSFQSLVLSLSKGIFNLAAKPSEAYPSKLH